MMRPTSSDNDPVGPVVQPPQFAPPTGAALEGQAPLITQPAGRHRHTSRRLVVAAIAVVAIGAVTAVVVTRRSGSDEGNTSAGTVATTEAPEASDDPRDATAADAHVAYLAGQCEQVMALYEPLLADADWVASADAAEQAQSEYDECADLLAIGAGTGTPAEQLALYLAFLDARPGTPLENAVVVEIQGVYLAVGAPALTAANCDALDGEFAMLTTSDVGAAMLGCVDVYQAAGRNDAAQALALEALSYTKSDEATARAVAVAVADPAVCEDLGGGVEFVDIGAYPAKHAALLQGCMAAAAAAMDIEGLAALQVRYLVDVPDQPDAAQVEAALIENIGACNMLTALQTMPEIADRPGVLTSVTFKCAELAFYVGDTEKAIGLYRWFLANDTEGDPRTATAEAGLAWNLIAQARAAGTNEWDNPGRSGSADSGIARMIIRNDAKSDLEVTITGPQTHFVTIEGSPTSTSYPPGGRVGCRLDTPSLTLDLAPGQYEVMFERNGDAIAVGSWNLRSGNLYDFCLYLVQI